MRKLKAPDVFAALRVVAAVEIKDDITTVIKAIVKQSEAETKTETKADAGTDAAADEAKKDFVVRVGVNGALKLVEMASGKAAEPLIYEFLAGPLEMTPAAVKDLDAADFLQAVVDIATENDLSGFFDSVLKLRQKM